MFKKTSRVFALARDRLRIITTYRKKVLVFVERWPLTSFFVVLMTMLLFIVLGAVINKPKQTVVQETPTVKTVDVYRIGSAPKITVQAKTIKSGVIQITALTSGVIDKIYHKEGDTVKKGELLVRMSTNYQGGNALSLQSKIASAQYQDIKDAYPTQKEIIQKQIEVAKKTDENSDQLREITAKSIDETRNLISINEDILVTLDANIAALTASGTDPALLLATKQLKSQFVASTNAARSSLRSAERESAGDKPSAQLSDLQRDITVKQLEIQNKQLDLQKEVARLQLLIAQVNAATMFPAAPFNGTVQRVFVKEKQAVTPGTPLMVFSQTVEEDPITAMVLVSHDIAKRISVLEPSILSIGGIEYPVYPSFISTEAVEGTLYAVYYPIPDELNSDVVSDGYISVDIPVGYFDTTVTAAFIPLDSIYQTRDNSYIFVLENGMAKSKTVVLGHVFGRFVEIQSGINHGDVVILNRTVIDGDLVETN